jgi:hypothetical protein
MSGTTRAAAAGVVVAGNPQVEPGSDSDPAGMAEAFRFSATASGAVTDLMVYVDASSSASTLVAGLYADSGGGHPGALLAKGTLASPAGGTWNDVTVPQVTATAGTIYWIAILGTGGTLAFRDRCCGGGQPSETSATSTLTTLPPSWATGTAYQDGPASVYATQAAPPPPPSTVGQWSALTNWPLVSVHTTLLPTGNVLAFDAWATPTTAQVYNPATGSFTAATNPSDIFCGGNVTLADGRVLVAGGHVPGPDAGMAETNLFNPTTGTWARGADMHAARWYPSVTELADGRVLALSGEVTIGTYSDTPEIYDPGRNTWTQLSSISTSQVHEPEYPLTNLLPSGKVFTLAPSTGQSFLLDPAATSWTQVGSTSSVRNGSAVMYRPGKVLYAGGGNIASTTNPASTAAQTIDLTAPTPVWAPTVPMSSGRYEHTLVMLPDGNVLAVGGASVTSQDPSVAGALPVEQWSPATGTWTTLASMAVERGYHSTAILMPDGRVLVGGGGKALGSTSDPGQYNIQYYSPPYLFNGARPAITSAPSSATYGSTMFVQTPDAASIASVSLVDLSSDTHTTDMNQHFVPLSFTQAPGGLNVTAPASAGLAPPGHYMLFIVNAQGVPSVAPIVAITPQPPAVTITAPSAGASVSGTAVAVSADIVDGIPVSGAQLQVDGTPVGPKVSQSPYTFSWDSSAVANGSHALSVQATDASGAVGTSSPVTVTVTNPAPVVSGARVTALSSTTATLAWSTDVAADSQVTYGVSTTYGSTTPLDLTRTTAHAQTISGLKSGTVYHCSVRSTNGGGTGVSPDIQFITTTGPPPLSIDLITSKDGRGALTTTPFSTSSPNDVLIALVGSDGGSAKQSVTVSGGGLTWTLVRRVNTQGGDSEIWTATAPAPLSGATVTSSPSSGGFDQSLTVIAVAGASGVGASAGASAPSGAPSTQLTSAAAGSLVLGVGNDYDNPLARTPASGQTLQHQWLDQTTGDAFWVQGVSAATTAAGQVVRVNDTAPTSDQWNLAAVEVRP